MIIDFLIAKDGLRIDDVAVRFSGVRLRKGGDGLTPQLAGRVEGSVRILLDDLVAAFARPEILDQLLSGVSGIARPEIAVTDAADGGIRITGSIELMGRRFPISAFSRLSIVDNRVVVSATQLDGLPMLGALSSRLPSLALPLVLPAGLEFTGVTTESGAIVVSFEGEDVPLGGEPPLPKAEPPAPRAGRPLPRTAKPRDDGAPAEPPEEPTP